MHVVKLVKQVLVEVVTIVGSITSSKVHIVIGSIGALLA